MQNICLHVTSAAKIESILREGLIAQIGPLAQCIESVPGVYFFPNWESMQDANWLFDEDTWPHASEPALLCVDTQGLDLESDVGYEFVYRGNIEPHRITVLAPGESDWDKAKVAFENLGGV